MNQSSYFTHAACCNPVSIIPGNNDNNVSMAEHKGCTGD